MSEEEGNSSPQEVSPSPQAGEKCPIVPQHVKLFEECCDKYAKGEMSDLDVISTVVESLKKLRENK